MCDADSVWIDQRGSEVIPLPECHRLLATAAKKGAIGRLAVSLDQAPLVRPLNFAYDDHSVVVLLGSGLALEAATDALVTFEVDDVDHDAGVAWSVLVRGLATTVPAGAAPSSFARSLPAPLVPEPGEMLVSIRTDVVTGRRFPLHE